VAMASSAGPRSASFANTAGGGIAPHTLSLTRPGGSAVSRRERNTLFEVLLMLVLHQQAPS